MYDKVRALVRDEVKAKELFKNELINDGNELKIITCDLGKYSDPNQRSIIEDAIYGVDAIISVSGTMRFSKITDFIPPWKLLNDDVSPWCDDTSHPYYTNYKAQCFMIDTASKEETPPRFIRLTGLSTGFSTFNLFTLIFSSILSQSSRYHFLCEQYLRMQEKVPYVILRPGGLADEERDAQSTFLQIEPSGYLPPPGRVPRADVAALAVYACDTTIVPPAARYTLGVRAVGDIKPKAQGEKEDGYDTAKECLVQLGKKNIAYDEVSATMEKKSYGLAVGLFVYGLVAIGFKVSIALVQFVLKFFS